jgi:hypothetical protein
MNKSTKKVVQMGAFLCLIENSCVTCWCYDFPVVHVSDVKRLYVSCLERSLHFQKIVITEKHQQNSD